MCLYVCLEMFLFSICLLAIEEALISTFLLHSAGLQNPQEMHSFEVQQAHGISLLRGQPISHFAPFRCVFMFFLCFWCSCGVFMSFSYDVVEVALVHFQKFECWFVWHELTPQLSKLSILARFSSSFSVYHRTRCNS